MLDISTINLKKILVIQQRQLGDVLLSTGTLPLIQEKFPQGKIDFVTEKKCAPIVENNPYINKLFLIDKKEQKSFFSQIQFYKEIGNNGYDLVISYQNLPRCLLLTYFSQGKYRLGQKSQWYKNLFYTHTSQVISQYAANKKADILLPLGIKPTEAISPQWYISEAEKKAGKDILQSLGFTEQHTLISLDITHKDNKRRYPPEYYAEILNGLALTFPHKKFAFFFLRQEGEEEQINNCIGLLNENYLIILPEKAPNLRISAAIMSYAALHMGNCSFPRHLAVALDIPSITFVGASDNTWAFPSSKHMFFSANLPCQPCSKKNCEAQCLTELLPHVIFQQVCVHFKNFL